MLILIYTYGPHGRFYTRAHVQTSSSWDTCNKFIIYYDNYVNNYSYPKVIGGIFDLLLPKNKSRNEFTQITIIGKTISLSKQYPVIPTYVYLQFIITLLIFIGRKYRLKAAGYLILENNN